MDNSVNRYLHKKFKKQSSVEPKNYADKEAKPASPSILQNKESSVQNNVEARNVTCIKHLTTSNEVRARQNNNDSVPKQSTNNETTLNLNELNSSSLAKSSISHTVLAERSKDANNWNSERCIRTNETVEPQSSLNSCISYVFPRSSRVDNIQSQLESQPRPVNFDTKLNISESRNNSIAESSSILENAYSKHPFIPSKIAYIEKSGDASTDCDLEKEHFANAEDVTGFTENKSVEIKTDINHQESVLSDKNSGGKYICTYCNLACSKPSVLQKHIRAHTNERPYPCISCGFSFKTRSNLYKHCRSRTHANRVMGNKVQEINNDADIDTRNKIEHLDQIGPAEVPKESGANCGRKEVENEALEKQHATENDLSQNMKSKPYKPRFHTSKVFFDSVSKENEHNNVIGQKNAESPQRKHSNPDMLSVHINELINKNNSIINSNESYFLKKRAADGNFIDSSGSNEYLSHYNESSYFPSNTILDQRNHDEPLNLTNKNRKRCLSEVAEPVSQKSLIKELLLKNLYADSNMQCPYCKMIFQTVTELELHKLRNCRGFTKPGAKYSRSSSVNVASILTHNKNAFDDLPQLQNSVFPLKSPGPFLGKTRLIESDKCKSFSFDDALSSAILQSPTDILKASQRYSISPLTLKYDKVKKTPVKLFGGEVKITHTTGETKSFKIESKEADKYGDETSFMEYGGKLSENRVVKSSLQSGGTVLQNKPNYNDNQNRLGARSDVIRVYENTSVSPSIDIASLEKTKFNFDRQVHVDVTPLERKNSTSPEISLRTSTETVQVGTCFNNAPYKYTNIMDFSQNAVKLLTPNLKQLNLAIPGVPVPNKMGLPRSPISFRTKQDKVYEPNAALEKQTNSTRAEDKHNFVQRQIHSLTDVHGPSPYNPVNLLVNGKVVRYVPGIPGPIAADTGMDDVYSNHQVPLNLRSRKFTEQSYQKPVLMETSASRIKDHSNFERSLENKMTTYLQLDKNNESSSESKSPVVRNNEIKSPSKPKSPNNTLPSSSGNNESPRKFARPTSLALKPSIASIKQHHGLTPTMFNQVLISPDTPRIAKKYNQHFLHGNYFSYLGLKSSTKSVYCTLNKTQPCYVQFFKKLSMYSEWRQQDNKPDKLYAGAYDSRQMQQKYTTAGKAVADLVVHSSYKFVVTNRPLSKEDHGKNNSVFGGYESNEDYTYIRGRGRGRYVCDQCGIRCKKPSMLKKHIRTHSNDRPYTCNHCNFSFKTKGNLTKHMKSKAHTKNYAASNTSSSSTQQSGTQSSESDTEDSGMDSSDESTRQQEHEAAYGLLSLSQKPAQNIASNCQSEQLSSSPLPFHGAVSSACVSPRETFMNTEEITQVINTNFAKNKILDQKTLSNFTVPKHMKDIGLVAEEMDPSKELQDFNHFFGKTSSNRPLTYPYTTAIPVEVPRSVENSATFDKSNPKHFHVIQRYNIQQINSPRTVETFNNKFIYNDCRKNSNLNDHRKMELSKNNEDYSTSFIPQVAHPINSTSTTPILKVNDRVVINDNNTINDLRKRKIGVSENNYKLKLQRNDTEVMDLSVSLVDDKSINTEKKYTNINQNENKHAKNFVNIFSEVQHSVIDPKKINNDIVNNIKKNYEHKVVGEKVYTTTERINFKVHHANSVSYDQREIFYVNNNANVKNKSEMINSKHEENDNGVGFIAQENLASANKVPDPANFKLAEYDNSAMETLADVATKQVKLEKNTLAKSVASEFLKLATKNEFQNNDSQREAKSFATAGKDVNELIVKPEENKSCTICSKNFSKPSQLRLHMNIHYLERPFRCDSCSVSFRTKGHLQKHERSASHHNKLTSSPALSSSEPRPFKCSDCDIGFRIHGHLAKHLRSKMHIMKLECLAKIPFGLYAELERANSLLTEINTADGDQCLESLKALAKKVFINDPSKLNQIEAAPIENVEVDT